MTRQLRLLCATIAVTVWSALGVAGAHTAVRSADPGPGETVSGVVDRVVVEFLDPVVPTPQIEVRGPGGDPVRGLGATTLHGGDRVAERGFAPLEEPGPYRVDYRYVAIDGAEQRGAHQFRYEAEEAGPGPSGLLVGGAAVVVAAAASVLVVVRAARATRLDAAD